MTVALIVLAVWAVAVTITLGLCSAASAGDRRLLAADDVDTAEFPAPEPTPAQRAAAWDVDDPTELRRAAREWRRIGATDYAAMLEAAADGEITNLVRRPW